MADRWVTWEITPLADGRTVVELHVPGHSFSLFAGETSIENAVTMILRASGLPDDERAICEALRCELAAMRVAA